MKIKRENFLAVGRSLIPIWSKGPIVMIGYMASRARINLGQKIYLK
jgi:hypothetical protein